MDPRCDFQTMVQLIVTRPERRMGIDGPQVVRICCAFTVIGIDPLIESALR